MNKKDPFPLKKSIKPKKKRFQIVLIRKVGTDFEVSNGSVKFKGPNRTQLLEQMDRWEVDMHAESRTAKSGSRPTADTLVKIGKIDIKKKVGRKKSIKKPTVKPSKKKLKQTPKRRK